MTEQEMRRARVAKVVLAEAVLAECLADLETYYTESWKTSSTTEEREENWRNIAALHRILAEITAWAEAPEFEARSEQRKSLQSKN